METPAWAQAIIVRPEQSYASGPTPAYRYGLPSCAHAYATAAAAPGPGAGTLNGWPPMPDGPRPVPAALRAAEAAARARACTAWNYARARALQARFLEAVDGPQS